MTELDILTALARAVCCQATSELITIMNIHDKAKSQGLILQHQISAKELRQQNPKLAAKWAGFIRDNKQELVQSIAGRVM